MTIGEAYTRFLMLVNRNATNNRIHVDKPRFILLFNGVQNKFVEWSLDKRNQDSIRDIQKILVQDFTLSLTDSNENQDRFALPTDYFDLSNISAKAKNGCCDARRITLYEVKSEDVEEKLADKYSEPSFDWEESFYYLTQDSVSIYKKDFTIEEAKLTYYRYPIQVDISGYTRLDNTVSSDIDPEFDDKVVGRILLAMAKEHSANISDPTGYQMDKDRLFTI